MSSNPDSGDMCMEANRLKSFESNWSIAFIDPKILAMIGMFYIGPGAAAKCFSCGTEINEWKEGEPEIVQHKHQAPHCPLLVWKEEKNIPLDELAELALAKMIWNQWNTGDNFLQFSIRHFAIKDRDLKKEDDCCTCGIPCHSK